MTVYVLGHKNPDTDSICSAVAYAKIKGYEPAITGKLSNEAEFVLKQFRIPTPIELKNLKEKDIILVDHNSRMHSIDGYEEANILEVIDHHPIDFKSKKPITITMKPVGAASTIIGENYNGTSRVISGLLLSGILSDTLLFKTDTTTPLDKEVAKRMAETAKIDIKRWGEELIKLKTDITGMTAEELLKKDLKQGLVNNQKYYVSKIEVSDNEQVETKKEEIKRLMKEELKKQKLSAYLTLITNVKEEKTEIIIEGLQSFDNKTPKNGEIKYTRILSRKLDIYPKLIDLFSK